jgi:hypothetical protein
MNMRKLRDLLNPPGEVERLRTKGPSKRELVSTEIVWLIGGVAWAVFWWFFSMLYYYTGGGGPTHGVPFEQAPIAPVVLVMALAPLGVWLVWNGYALAWRAVRRNNRQHGPDDVSGVSPNTESL